MANYENLKSAIQQVVKTNGKNAITGALLQQSLLAIINSLGAGYQFIGVATPATNPGTPDKKVFYIASTAGTYSDFGGLEVTEDEVVILTWDSSWHKVPTGITKGRDGAPGPEGPQGPKGDKMTYSDLTEADKADLYEGGASLIRPLLDGKQDTLQLTVKDNGNIVLANLQGQSKEFMPATPSGDPMHYAYVAAGAEYNDTGADIIKTTPWADMIDDDYTGDYGKTVVHKAGYWYLNGLGDITTDEIRTIYQLTSTFPEGNMLSERLRNMLFRTNFCNRRQIAGYENLHSVAVNASNKNCRVFSIYNSQSGYDIGYGFYSNTNLIHIIGEIYKPTSTPIFNDTTIIYTIKIKSLIYNISIPSPNLSMKSVLFMITNEAATSAITITLHADVYTRAMANADIVAALEAHPNVSLASA